MSSQQTDRFPEPPNMEAMFGEALLVLGEIPRKGWRIHRAATGAPTYIAAGSRVTGKYREKAVQFFSQRIVERYSHRKWKPGHIRVVAQNWKNRYLLWLFREIERE